MLSENFGLAKGMLLRHYKGGIYTVEGLCLLTCKGKVGVPALLFRHIFGSETHCIPIAEAFETVPGPSSKPHIPLFSLITPQMAVDILRESMVGPQVVGPQLSPPKWPTQKVGFYRWE